MADGLDKHILGNRTQTARPKWRLSFTEAGHPLAWGAQKASMPESLSFVLPHSVSVCLIKVLLTSILILPPTLNLTAFCIFLQQLWPWLRRGSVGGLSLDKFCPVQTIDSYYWRNSGDAAVRSYAYRGDCLSCGNALSIWGLIHCFISPDVINGVDLMQKLVT